MAMPSAISSFCLTARAPSFMSDWKNGPKALPISRLASVLVPLVAGQNSSNSAAS
jgi:hypothetical protein